MKNHAAETPYEKDSLYFLSDPDSMDICAVLITDSGCTSDKHYWVKLKLADEAKAQARLAFGYAKCKRWYIDPEHEYAVSELSKTPEEAYNRMLELYKQQYKKHQEAASSFAFKLDHVRELLQALEAEASLKYKIGSRVWAIVKLETGELDVAKERIDKINKDNPSSPYHYTDCWHKGWLGSGDVFDARADAVKECQRRLREHCARRCAELVLPDEYEDDDE